VSCCVHSKAIAMMTVVQLFLRKVVSGQLLAIYYLWDMRVIR